MSDQAVTQAPDDATFTDDALLDGRVRLRQPRRGYRAGLDAALLAAAVELHAGERGLEAGCGAGGALLQVAARWPEARLTGLERDAGALQLARGNVAANGFGDRVTVAPGEVESGFATLREAPFDAAFANPPFFDDPGALRGPAPERRGAWLADAGLAAWTGFLLQALREGGRATVIHRADRLADLLAGLSQGGGSLQVRPVQPFADAPAKRVLVRAAKGGRAPLRLLPALVLHAERDGRWTDRADAILRGRERLEWAGQAPAPQIT